MNSLKTILVRVDFSTVSRSALERAVWLAGLNGASLHILQVVDTTAVGIVAHARQTAADLIVIGRKGSTNLRYVLLGSTAEQLLTILPTALLVVKPAAQIT